MHPLFTSRTQEELIEHLLENSVYDESSGCILWQGCTAGNGVTCWQGKQVYIHRLAYHFEHPEEKLDVIRHTCDTPNCWNLEHLRNGTTLDNVLDKVIKGRQPRGSAMHNAAFTEDDIVDIRNSPLNLYELGDKYAVNPVTIFYIRKRKTWKHVP